MHKISNEISQSKLLYAVTKNYQKTASPVFITHHLHGRHHSSLLARSDEYKASNPSCRLTDQLKMWSAVQIKGVTYRGEDEIILRTFPTLDQQRQLVLFAGVGKFFIRESASKCANACN